MSDPILPLAAVPAATLNRTIETLLDGLNGFRFSDDRELTANTLYPIESPIPDGVTPYLGLFGCEATIVEYTPSIDRITVNATLFLKVRSHREQAGESSARDYFDGLMVAFDRIRGLPVDAEGKISPRSDEPAFDPDPAAYLVDVTGPKITRAVVNEQTGSPYATVTLSVRFDYDQDREALRTYYAKKAVVRGIVADAARWQVPPEFPAIEPTAADTFAAGFHDTEAPDTGGAARMDPPFADGLANPPAVLGPDPDDVLVRVDVLPSPKSVAALATTQLQAFAVVQSGKVRNVTDAATWATSDATKATVAAGLVTGVAAGSAAISATWLGVVGASAITVS